MKVIKENEQIVLIEDYKKYLGVKFIPRSNNKRNDVYTVVDIHTTRNIKNEVVSVVLIAEHDFLGQKIKSEHPVSSVIRGIIK